MDVSIFWGVQGIAASTEHKLHFGGVERDISVSLGEKEIVSNDSYTLRRKRNWNLSNHEKKNEPSSFERFVGPEWLSISSSERPCRKFAKFSSIRGSLYSFRSSKRERSKERSGRGRLVGQTPQRRAARHKA